MKIYKAIFQGLPAAKALHNAIEAQTVSADILGVRISGEKITVTYENEEYGTYTEAMFLITPKNCGFDLTEISYKIGGEEQYEKFGLSDLMIEDALCEEVGE